MRTFWPTLPRYAASIRRVVTCMQSMRDHGIRLAAARQGQQADVRIVQIACADAASVQRVRDEHVACGARAAGVAVWCR